MVARGHVSGACRLPMCVPVAGALHGMLKEHDLPPPCFLPSPALPRSEPGSIGGRGRHAGPERA